MERKVGFCNRCNKLTWHEKIIGIWVCVLCLERFEKGWHP
jgi:ribosomal protein L37AE/L43A